ncbi:MAG TPA: hypothetical protein VGK92_15280 [Gaiellales bacterium]|jgi:hypothetical protein
MTHPRISHRWALGIALAVALPFAATATANSNTYKLALTTPDSAAARAVMLEKTDIGSPSDWQGGATKHDVATALSCANFHLRLSDLVITGEAAVSFRQAGIVMASSAEVFQTPRMVALDLQRSVDSPHFFSCLRSLVLKTSSAKARVVSFRKLVFPTTGERSVGFRELIDVKTANGTVRVASDSLSTVKGRTELSLETTTPVASLPTIWPNELVLLAQLVNRARV